LGKDCFAESVKGLGFFIAEVKITHSVRTKFVTEGVQLVTNSLELLEMGSINAFGDGIKDSGCEGNRVASFEGSVV
jgi:hypothetical protein